MEESQEILLDSLANSGVPIPAGVSSIGDLTPATLLWICSQSLRLIDKNSSFPTSLPDSVADQFKICTELASAITNLGFVGDMSFHKFLYPSEDDLYKLVRFFVEKLSEVSGAGEAYEKSGTSTKATTKEVDSKGTSKDCTVKTDGQGVDLNDQEVTDTLKSLRLKNEVPWSSISRSEEASVSAAVVSSFKDQELTSVENGSKSMGELRDSGTDTYVNEGTMVQEDDRHDVELEQKLVSIREQSSKIRSKIDKLQSQEGVLMEELTAKTLETQHLEEEHESLQAAMEMALDDQHPADFYVVQLNEQADTKRQNLVELESQWNTIRRTLEEKRRSLEEVLYATKPEAQEKLQKLKGFELEIQSVLSEIEKRKEECSKLSADLEKQPKLASRRSYIQRITEITKNSRKQDADIERILKETRELQLESNSIQERLHRTYTVVDETVFREAKKDPTARQAYRLLTHIHESFEQISEKILATDRTRREVAEHEARLATLASRSINIDKLQADLDAIRKENDFLEHHHGDDLKPLASL